MVTGPMPRKPKATRPNAKIGAANLNCSGMMDINALLVENCHAANMSSMMTKPIQNAEKLPATKPDRMFREAPPCLEQLVTSLTCRELVLTKILVNSGINAPATVPQLMMAESTHQSAGCATPFMVKSPSNSLLATNVMAMDTAEVIHTRWVNGASKSKSFLLPNMALLMTSLRK